MNFKVAAIPFIAFALGACAAHEGRYSPDCIAFAGNRIDLADGLFVWEKFSDQVIIGEDGNVVDQFPDFPKRGTYRMEGRTVHMSSRRGAPMPHMYLVSQDGRHYLLTAEQNRDWERSGQLPNCALTRNRKDAG